MTRHKQRPDQPRPGHQNPAGGRTSLQPASTVNTPSHHLLMAAWALEESKAVSKFQAGNISAFLPLLSCKKSGMNSDCTEVAGGQNSAGAGQQLRHLHDIYSPVAVDTRYLLRLLDI